VWHDGADNNGYKETNAAENATQVSDHWQRPVAVKDNQAA